SLSPTLRRLLHATLCPYTTLFRSENERLRAREGAIDQRIEQALQAERKRLEQTRGELAGDRQVTQSLLQELQLRLDALAARGAPDRKSTRLNSSHVKSSYAVFCLK